MSSAQFLFNRQWAVTIGIPGDTGYTYEKLKTTFDIDKTSEATSNKAKITLFNFTRISRITFQKKGLIIRLDAGYTGLMETVFLGDVVRVETKRSGANILTTFECGDAEKRISQAHFEKSYPAGVKFVTIIQDLAVALGVNIGTVIGIQDQTYQKGFSTSGTIAKAMKNLLTNQGLEWNVQNNYLNIYPITKHNGEEAIVLSAETGLIGEPSLKESGIQFEALLNPRLVPGQPVQIISNTINGYYKIRRSHFEGDSHGEKWGTTCEGVRISATQALPFNSGTKFATIGSIA